MSVIAQDVFITAMNLMDEESEDGTFAGYPDEYKKKAWPLLTMLQAELLPPAVAPLTITSETNTFQIDDRSALTIMPYGLAAHLLMNEDRTKAAFFNARYDELKRKRPAKIVAIKDVYGIFQDSDSSTNTSGGNGDMDGGGFSSNDDSIYDGGEF